MLLREAEAIERVAESLDSSFGETCRLIADCKGLVVVSGVGKAGLIARKVSATLASTGTRSVWLDPLNALHGDIGIVSGDDVALLLSNSGTTSEILAVAEGLRAVGVEIVAVTGERDSPLARACETILCFGHHAEACPLQLAPSTSTTIMLALGDALALAVQEERGFSAADYARYHPAGALGRRLSSVRELMRRDDRVARTEAGSSILEAVGVIAKARCGLCAVVSDTGELEGVYTDGDFRRDCLAGVDVRRTSIRNQMTSPCRFVREDMSVGDAIDFMRQTHVNALPVVDSDLRVTGLLDLQDVA